MIDETRELELTCTCTQRRGIEIGIEERGARGALMEKTESQFANRHHDSGFLARA